MTHSLLTLPAEPHRPGCPSPQCGTVLGRPLSSALDILGFAGLGGSEGMTKLGKAVSQRENNDCSKHAPGGLAGRDALGK